MASITIRSLDDDIKARLRVRAAEHGRSMEEEVRILLREAVSPKPNQVNLKAGLESAHGSSVSVRSCWFASGEGVTDPALLR